MEYAKVYTEDDLFAMFLSPCTVEELANQETSEVAARLALAKPDMEDVETVANIIRRVAMRKELGIAQIR